MDAWLFVLLTSVVGHQHILESPDALTTEGLGQTAKDFAMGWYRGPKGVPMMSSTLHEKFVKRSWLRKPTSADDDNEGPKIADTAWPPVPKENITADEFITGPRVIDPSPEYYLDDVNRAQFLQNVRDGKGAEVPDEERISDVKVLTVQGKIASVLLEMRHTFSLMQMVHDGSRWRIIHVLQDPKTISQSRRVVHAAS